jgi:hypothetical protein
LSVWTVREVIDDRWVVVTTKDDSRCVALNDFYYAFLSYDNASV